MKKLELRLDALRVETFSTAAGRAVAGTVRGHYDTGWECEGEGDSEVSCPAACSELCTRTCNSGPVACCADD
ncbi:MAG TPA: hypothetical protein VFR81_25985 [Longimicrobium sp.]|nr:hypothetical protein [Longimicrobium sp.]